MSQVHKHSPDTALNERAELWSTYIYVVACAVNGRASRPLPRNIYKRFAKTLNGKFAEKVIGWHGAETEAETESGLSTKPTYLYRR